MIDVQNRLVEYPTRFKLKAIIGTTDIYDLIPIPGSIIEEGTKDNRTLYNDLQGFANSVTRVNADGSIIETSGDVKLTIKINEDNSITSVRVSPKSTITKTTRINADGSISEEVS